MEPVRISAEDTAEEVATKIFHRFEINQSCSIKGFCIDGEELIPKGEVVLQILEKIDTVANSHKDGKRFRRKRVLLPDSIGGFVAQKIFRFKKETVDRELKITIWRVQ